MSKIYVDEILPKNTSTIDIPNAKLPVGTVVNKQSYPVTDISSTSQTYIDIISIVYTPKNVGNIIEIDFTGVFSQNNGGAAGIMMKLQVDGVDYDVPPNGGELILYTSSGFDQYVGGVFKKSLSASKTTHTFKIQARALGSQTNGWLLGSAWSNNRVYITEIAQ